MPANTDPTYTLTPDLSFDNAGGMAQPITLLAGDYTGIGANNRLLHTAGANGSFVRSIIGKASGTNVASVLRLFANNGLTPGTAANNAFIGEISLPATTISAVAGTVEIELPLEFAMRATHRLYGGLGTAVAAGWTFTVVGGQY